MLERITVWVGKDWDGFTFRLQPQTRKMIAELFPEANMLAQVSISFGERTTLESIKEPVFTHILELLLGLGNVEIQKYGGARFLDSTNDELIYDTVGL